MPTPFTVLQDGLLSSRNFGSCTHTTFVSPSNLNDANSQIGQSFLPRLPRPPHFLLRPNAYPPLPLPRRRNISLRLPDFVHQDRHLPPYLRRFPVQGVPRVVACQLGPQLDKSLLAGGELGGYSRHDALSTMGFGAVETGVDGPVTGEEVVFLDGVVMAAVVVVVGCFVGGHCVLDVGLFFFFTLLGYLMRWLAVVMELDFFSCGSYTVESPARPALRRGSSWQAFYEGWGALQFAFLG